MRVPFLDLRVPDSEQRAALHAVLENILESGRVIPGKHTRNFEGLLRRESGLPHAVAVSSGTEAVWMALRLAGVSEGDEVITAALGWLGTINPIMACNAIPVFADIEPDLNLSPAAVREAITPNTRAIVAVHYTGHPCQMDELVQIAEEHGLALIEDCAQAYGATYRGKPVGSLGDVGAFSMNPMKLFSGIGEAGGVVFQDDAWLETAHALRHNGLYNEEYCLAPSLNLKPDELQSGFLVAKRDWLDQVQDARRNHAQYYDEHLKPAVIPAARNPEDERVYYTYMIRAERRDELQAFLAEREIESKVRHPVLLNEQKAYAIAPSRPTPEAEKARDDILCLPIHEKLVQEQLEFVVQSVHEFYER